MKLGITGSGMIVRSLLDFIHQVDGVELVGIASTPQQISKVKELAKLHDIDNAYIDYSNMLMNEEIDTIYLGVPNHLHFPLAKQALDNGKNVICEKPFTSNYDEAIQLMNLARSKKLFLFEAITTTNLPNVRKINELLHEIGDIKIIIANYSQYSSRYNAFKNGEILPAFDKNKSGGALMDLNIYNIHFVVSLFGVPTSVNYQANIEKGIDTSGILNLDYGTFKAVLIGAKDCKSPVTTNIQGDKGCINITTPLNSLSEFNLLLNDGTNQTFNLHKNGEHRMYYEFIEFERIIRERDFLCSNDLLDKSIAVMKIATEARKSAGVVFQADNR